MPTYIMIFVFCLFAAVLAIILISAITNLRRNKLSDFISAPSLQLENMELMNKLLKQKLEKGEVVTDEEIAMMQELNKSSKK